MNVRKICGTLFLLAGPVCIVTGVSRTAGAFDERRQASNEWFEASKADPWGNHPMPSSGPDTGMGWIVAGFFLLTGGAFLTFSGVAGPLMRRLHRIRLPGTPDMTTEIERLAKLRADGYITGDDYEAAKKKLLSDL